MSNLQDEFDNLFKGKRFTVRSYPQVISLGDFFVVQDTFGVMGEISFGTDWTEAEEFCIFLNNLFYTPFELIEILVDKYVDVDESNCEILFELKDLLNQKIG